MKTILTATIVLSLSIAAVLTVSLYTPGCVSTPTAQQERLMGLAGAVRDAALITAKNEREKGRNAEAKQAEDIAKVAGLVADGKADPASLVEMLASLKSKVDDPALSIAMSVALTEIKIWIDSQKQPDPAAKQ